MLRPRLGITVENAAYAPDGVADFTLMLILMAIRNAKAIVSSANTSDFRLAGVRGKELRDMTVGVVGVGNIGSAVIGRLRGFGCRVLASDNRGRAAAELVSLDELLRESDVVTLHLPLNADTHHLIGRKQIETMKQGAYLVNTGRGSLVDTDSLIAALEDGRVGGAALDVLEGEEGFFYFDCTNRSVDDRRLGALQRLPNVIITPHTAYYTERAAVRHRRTDVDQVSQLRTKPRYVLSRPCVAILFGGCSEEHDVSVKSAIEVAASIDTQKYEPIYIGITKRGAWKMCERPHHEWNTGECRSAVISPDRSTHGLLVEKEPAGTRAIHIDVVFPVLHGKLGEDGAVQGLIELSGIPYVGCDIQSSAICMDKSLAYLVARAGGIDTPAFSILDDADPAAVHELEYPVFVKPARFRLVVRRDEGRSRRRDARGHLDRKGI